MADTDSYIKHQKLVNSDQNQQNPSKFYYHFLYKAAIVTVFLIILPLFPSQAPEFINQTVFTRSWELLHLLFVGIAISYGLFSRRNDETEKENNSSKFDNAQSYMSRFLQVSSVFDDDTEIQSGSDENKIQTWSSQYYRNEPVVVVAQENSVVDEQRGSSSRISEKPLLLPVRSLKSRVPDTDGGVVSVNETSSNSVPLGRSNSKTVPRRFSINSSRSRNGDFGGLEHQELEDKLKENVVLPSPIPWRSRSGRMEMKEDVDNNSPPLYTLPPSMEESEFNRVESRVSRTHVSRSSRPNSKNSSPKLSPSPSLSSPKKLTPSSSLSSESQAKNAEDSVKKTFYMSSPPPPPPPPPPMFQRSSTLKPSSGYINGVVSSEKEFRRSFTSESMDLNWRSGETFGGRVNSAAESQLRSQFDSLSMGRSVRTIKPGENVSGRGREIVGERGLNGRVERKVLETTTLIGRKRVGFEDQTSFKTEHLSRGSVWNPIYGEFQEQEEEEEEEEEDLAVEALIETEEEMDSEDDDQIGGSFMQNDIGENTKLSPKNEPTPSGSVSDGGPDVDKKADEFIAKFREQIRLQRIESIKRSSAQISKNLSRVQNPLHSIHPPNILVSVYSAKHGDGVMLWTVCGRVLTKTRTRPPLWQLFPGFHENLPSCRV
ncbi:hypothetical protein FEM48_Zijuj11G0064000 [Ziziphus jujuba var. spinosa]|uniref:Uncharacterized protein n=1 Tax=Ziziphus jujuba var. spinosa TaxID=714518 RepID=A0A978UHC4_ZIZJJ|nr:hypothetical protein FEM48_Zijuj11G0064000 [Ziziphus jujuba var. spinosa]